MPTAPTYASATASRRLEVHQVTTLFHEVHPVNADVGQFALAKCRKRQVNTESSTLVVPDSTPTKRFVVAAPGSQRVIKELATVPDLQERVATLEEELKAVKKQLKAEALDRRSAIALIGAVENASQAFGSTSIGPRRLTFGGQQPTRSCSLQPAARRPFMGKPAPWAEQVNIRNASAHPEAEDILIELLELDLLGVPMADEGIVLLLVGAFHNGGAGEVAELFASAKGITDKVPTSKQRTWLASLGLGFE